MKPSAVQFQNGPAGPFWNFSWRRGRDV